jgi:hypothetical protein
MFNVAVMYLPHEEGVLFPPQLVAVEASSEVPGAGALHFENALKFADVFQGSVFSQKHSKNEKQ